MDVSLVELLPNTEQYITYEGSLTSPACQESVTWIVFNKPIYMSQHQVSNSCLCALRCYRLCFKLNPRPIGIFL